jgi:hypothetical protein
MYTHIQLNELEQLDEADPELFNSLVKTFQRSRPATLAVSLDQTIMVSVEVWDMPGGLEQGGLDLIESFRRYLERANRGGDELSGLAASGVFDRMMAAS